VVVAVGVTVTDPEGPDAEKPVPLQFLAFVLLHISVADWPLGIERPKAERVAVGAGVAACATAIAEGFLDGETAPTRCAAPFCWIACPSAVAGGERVVIGVAFAEELELGVELTSCLKTNNAEKSKLSLLNTVSTVQLFDLF
jgi:hypothetical protein